MEEDLEELPYGINLVDLKMNNINAAYMEDLDELIRAQVKIPGRDGVPLLATVKKRRLDHK